MPNASRDENSVPTILGGLETNGVTLVPVKVDASSHALHVDDDNDGSDHGPVNAPRDENSVPAFMAVSETDGKTPVVLYATADGKLLIDSN